MVLDLLHNDFEVTTASVLEWGDKTIKEIEQILALTKVKLISKQATKMIEDLEIA